MHGATAQTALLFVSFALLVVSWSFPWTVLADTPVLDVTLLEPTLIAGGLLFIASRGWRFVQARDVRFMALVGVYFAWLIVAAALRASGNDLKQAVAYLAFAGGAAAIAFAAVRLDPPRAARWFTTFFGVAVLVAVLGAVLERATAPAPGAVDPLAAFWSLFRPQQGIFDPSVGFMDPFPLHYPLGEPGSIRTSGVFAHPLYLGFFGLLSAAFATAMVLSSWRDDARRRAVVALAVLVCAVLVTYWTYSRAPLAAVAGVVGMAIVLDLALRAWRLRRLPARADLVPGLLAVAIVVAVLVVSVAVDNRGLRRFGGAGLTITEPPVGSSVEASAGRSTRLRLRMQALAVDMVTASPGTMLSGPGVSAYLVRLQDRGPNGIPGAAGNFTHPHSAWLTVMLAGGIPAALLFGLVLLVLWRAAVRGLSRTRDGFVGAILLGAAAWIPVWAVAQLFGLHPLSSSEATIFGVLIGMVGGLAMARVAADDPDAAPATRGAG